jgi:hypothetical protein
VVRPAEHGRQDALSVARSPGLRRVVLPHGLPHADERAGRHDPRDAGRVGAPTLSGRSLAILGLQGPGPYEDSDPFRVSPGEGGFLPGRGRRPRSLQVEGEVVYGDDMRIMHHPRRFAWPSSRNHGGSWIFDQAYASGADRVVFYDDAAPEAARGLGRELALLRVTVIQHRMPLTQAFGYSRLPLGFR